MARKVVPIFRYLVTRVSQTVTMHAHNWPIPGLRSAPLPSASGQCDIAGSNPDGLYGTMWVHCQRDPQQYISYRLCVHIVAHLRHAHHRPIRSAAPLTGLGQCDVIGTNPDGSYGPVRVYCQRNLRQNMGPCEAHRQRLHIPIVGPNEGLARQLS